MAVKEISITVPVTVEQDSKGFYALIRIDRCVPVASTEAKAVAELKKNLVQHLKWTRLPLAQRMKK